MGGSNAVGSPNAVGGLLAVGCTDAAVVWVARVGRWATGWVCRRPGPATRPHPPHPRPRPPRVGEGLPGPRRERYPAARCKNLPRRRCSTNPPSPRSLCWAAGRTLMPLATASGLSRPGSMRVRTPRRPAPPGHALICKFFFPVKRPVGVSKEHSASRPWPARFGIYHKTTPHPIQ